MSKKNIYISDLKVGDRINNEPFSLKEFELKVSQQGKNYYNVNLGDRAGEIRGKVWSDNIPNCDKEAEIGEIVFISGIIQEYAGKPQIIIESLKVASDFPLEEFLPTTSRDRSLMLEEIESEIKGIKNPYLKKLVESFWNDTDYKDKYANYPAAERVHHAYVGGLIEHTWEMWNLSKPFFKLYPQLDKDLYFIGLFFHDVGKIEELEIKGATIIRTTSGRLVAHIAQGLLLVDRLIQQIDNFPNDLKDKLYHLLLSHQGSLEYGSPVVPQMLEALVLSMVDVNSADMNQATKHIEKEAKSGKEFTEYHRWLKRSLFKGGYIDDSD